MAFWYLAKRLSSAAKKLLLRMVRIVRNASLAIVFFTFTITVTVLETRSSLQKSRARMERRNKKVLPTCNVV